MTEAGGNATGSVDYTYFNMTDKAEAPKSSSSEAPKSSSSKTPKSSSSIGTIALPEIAQNFVMHDGIFMVFDMQGRALGAVEVPEGSTVAAAVKAKFRNAGIYLVKQGKTFLRVMVTP